MFFVNVFKFLFKIDAVYPVYRACPVINAAVYSGNNCPCLFPDYCKLFEQAGRPTLLFANYFLKREAIPRRGKTLVMDVR